MIKKGFALLLLIIAVYWSFQALLPSEISDIDTDKNSFSTVRALLHLEKISEKQHALGSEAHTEVRAYIIEALLNLGIETEVQEGYTISQWGNFAKAKNILARIKGSENGKALLLLSHYDSAPHSSYGASDAGSGVVTIIESLRAYLHSGKTPKNDIIVLISDGEELGLNGADLFVNQHEWAKDVGLVLNFEARGSGGASIMLVETNNGNANLIDAYINANPSHPVGNSLAYSIYKMLPNDTDLTRFREDANIDGFNFAFIDDHFDYHTANDTFERLDRNSLEHQGSYLMSMLTYLADENLNNLKSYNDKVYVNVPVFKTISYSYDYIWVMWILAVLIFGGLLFLGFKKRRFVKGDVLKGFIPLGSALLLNLLIGFLLWELLKVFYPQYSEMLHGFTYNGKTYIAAFSFLSLGICFWSYSKFYKPGNTASLLVAPLGLWILICLILAMFLKGASFLIIPVFFALVSLFVLINQRKPSLILLALLGFPLVMIVSPFIDMFPVGLGFYMKVFGLSISIKLISMVLITLGFGLLISLFGFYRHGKRWAYLMYLVCFTLLMSAHFKSGFDDENPRPNSLVYMLDIDNNEAKWASYDKKLDNWTRGIMGNDPSKAEDLNVNVLASKYNSGFTYSSDAPLTALVYPEVEVYKDTIIGDYREIKMYVASKRNASRIDFFSETQNVFKDFIINGVSAYKANENSNAFANRRSKRLFSYYVSDNDPLEMFIKLPKGQKTELIIYESTNDLLTDRKFAIKNRPLDMIPKPFILNDAVILIKSVMIN